MRRTTLADLLIRIVPLGSELGRHHLVASGGQATGLSCRLGTHLRRICSNRSMADGLNITRIGSVKGTRERAVSPWSCTAMLAERYWWRRRVGWDTKVVLRCVHTLASSMILTTTLFIRTRWPRWRVEWPQTLQVWWRCTQRQHLVRNTSSISGSGGSIGRV